MGKEFPSLALLGSKVEARRFVHIGRWNIHHITVALTSPGLPMVKLRWSNILIYIVHIIGIIYIKKVLSRLTSNCPVSSDGLVVGHAVT